MRALVVRPGSAGSPALVDWPEPPLTEGPVLVDGLAVGLCGTDAEVLAGELGAPPVGERSLVLGHENLGRVREAPPGSGLAEGDLVVGVVRRPDPDPCGACAAGEWDMCRDGRFTEHGISGRHGFARERWRSAPEALVRVDPALGERGVLLEPTTVVAKAWEQVERVAARAWAQPRVAVVTGAGPIGLLGALLGVQRGLEVHVFDRAADGPKPRLVRDLGAEYHDEPLAGSGVRGDVVLECTGAPALVHEVLRAGAPGGVTCLAGLSAAGGTTPVDLGEVGRSLVLSNRVVLGTVNANGRHYAAGAEALAQADPAWLDRLVTRRLPLARYAEALERGEHDVKVVLDLQAG